MIDLTTTVERKAPSGKFRVIAYLGVGEDVPPESYFVKDCDSEEEATSLVRSREERQSVNFYHLVFNDQGKCM